MVMFLFQCCGKKIPGKHTYMFTWNKSFVINTFMDRTEKTFYDKSVNAKRIRVF